MLLDVSPGLAGDFDRAILTKLGHPIIVCHGPTAKRLCPLSPDTASTGSFGQNTGSISVPDVTFGPGVGVGSVP